MSKKRMTIILFFIGIFIVAFIQDIKILGVSLIFFMGLCFYYKVSFIKLLKRIQVPLGLILIMVVFTMLFSKGQVVYSVYKLSVTDIGLLSGSLILGRFLCMMMITYILFSRLSIMDICSVMTDFHVPSIIVDLLIFTYRYIYEMDLNIKRMHRAMRLRGMKKSVKSLKAYSFLIGANFIRSYNQSDRVYHAMYLRGYENKRRKN